MPGRKRNCLLLRHGAHVNHDGRTPLHLVAGFGDVRIIEALLAQKPDLDPQDRDGLTPLMSALQIGHFSAAACLLQRGSRIDVVDKRQWSALFYAASAFEDRCTPLVAELLDRGIAAHQTDNVGATPVLLDIAGRLGRSSLVSIMVTALRRVGCVSFERSPMYADFHDAVRNGDVQRLSTLLRGGHAMPDAEFYAGFCRALERDDAALVRAMLAGGLDPNSESPMGKPLLLDSVWERAVASGVATALVEAGADAKVESPDGTTVLIWICGKADESFYHDRPLAYGDPAHELMESLASRLIQSGVDVNAVNDDGETALLWAAMKRRFFMVEILLQNGADPHAADHIERTPLMHAVTRRNSGYIMTTYLLRRGADILARDKDGRTPFAYAAGSGNVKVMGLLLEALEKRPLRPRSRLKILSAACVDAAGAGYATVVRQLLHHGVSADSENVQGKVALVQAAAWGKLEVVQELLENQASPDKPDSEHQTPLCAAAHRGSTEIVTALLESGANPNQPGKYGLTPLMVAADGAYPDMINSLLQAGADPNATVEYGETPLIRLVMAASTKIYPERVEESISSLVEHGAHVNACNDDGETPLLLAAGGKAYYRQYAEEEKPGAISAVKALLRAGADPQLASRKGLKPPDVARHLGYDAIAGLLSEAEGGRKSERG